MYKQKLHAAKQSVFVNIFLIILKLATAIFTGSLGVLAEVFHSFFDLLASILAFFGIKHAANPADEKHHYGHERIENISSLVQALLITITSFVIIYEVYKRIVNNNHSVSFGMVGIIVMVITIVIDYYVSNFLHSQSKETGSPALEADAYHFTTDIWSTAAVIIGLIASSLGFVIGDIIAAVVVSLLMLYLSFKLGLKAIHVVIDHAPSDKTIEKISTIISEYPQVKKFHSLRAREAGSIILVDVSIHLDKKMTLEKAHHIVDNLEKKIKKNCPQVREVIVHAEPEGKHHS